MMDCGIFSSSVLAETADVSFVCSLAVSAVSNKCLILHSISISRPVGPNEASFSSRPASCNLHQSHYVYPLYIADEICIVMRAVGGPSTCCIKHKSDASSG